MRLARKLFLKTKVPLKTLEVHNSQGNCLTQKLINYSIFSTLLQYSFYLGAVFYFQNKITKMPLGFIFEYELGLTMTAAGI